MNLFTSPLILKYCDLKVPYRFHRSQYIYHCAVQPLPVGHNVSQRVEISGVLHWQVDEWQQPVDGVHVSAQTHLGMSLRHQHPVEAETADTSPLTPSLNITHCYIIFYTALHC